MRERRIVVAIVTVCSLLLATGLLAAADERPRPHAEMALGADRIDWQPAGDTEQVVLTVVGPDGLRFEKEFAGNQPISLSLLDQEGNRLPEGAYIFELRLTERNSEQPRLQAGTFAVRNGGFASPFEPTQEMKVAKEPAIKKVTAQDVIADDLCVGALCAPGDEGPEILKLKNYYNVGIRFEDINEGLSYSRDWVLQANPNLGGPDHFFLQDVDAGTIPFSVWGDSPDYSLVVGSGGKIGIGTAIPSSRLHVLENVNANTLATVENSNTGASAAAFLRAKADVGTTQLSTHSSGRTITRFGQTLASRGEILHSGGNGLIIGTLESDDLILGTNNANRVQINGSTGAVTIAGNLTVNGTFSNPSSRALKESFELVDPKAILDKFAQLPIQEWSYKSDDRKLRHVGPTVEDFRSAFGLGTDGQYIIPMDVQGVTMTAVQGLYQVVQEKEAEIVDLRQRLAKLEELVSKFAAEQ